MRHNARHAASCAALGWLLPIRVIDNVADRVDERGSRSMCVPLCINAGSACHALMGAYKQLAGCFVEPRGLLGWLGWPRRALAGTEGPLGGGKNAQGVSLRSGALSRVAQTRWTKQVRTQDGKEPANKKASSAACTASSAVTRASVPQRHLTVTRPRTGSMRANGPPHSQRHRPAGVSGCG